MPASRIAACRVTMPGSHLSAPLPKERTLLRQPSVAEQAGVALTESDKAIRSDVGSQHSTTRPGVVTRLLDFPVAILALSLCALSLCTALGVRVVARHAPADEK